MVVGVANSFCQARDINFAKAGGNRFLGHSQNLWDKLIDIQARKIPLKLSSSVTSCRFFIVNSEFSRSLHANSKHSRTINQGAIYIPV